MAQATKKKPKNPRCRMSRLPPGAFRKLVLAFARDLSAKDAATFAKVSKPTAESIYRRLRERLIEYPLVTFNLGPEPPPDTRTVINRMTAGTATVDLPIHEIALLTRILNEQHFAGFEELDAANPDHVARAIRLQKMKVNGRRRYTLWEKLAPKPGETEPNTRPFQALECLTTSTILVNEAKADPHHAHFQYIWKLLLKHPL